MKDCDTKNNHSPSGRGLLGEALGAGEGAEGVPTTERSAKVTSSAPSPENILQTGLAFWASKTLLSAVEMGVFTELAQTGPQHFDELSGLLGLNPRSSRDFLDALVARQRLWWRGAAAGANVKAHWRARDCYGGFG